MSQVQELELLLALTGLQQVQSQVQVWQIRSSVKPLQLEA